MSIILDISGVILLVLGFWVLLSSVDRTGEDRTFRQRVAVGSMIAGLGNVLLTRDQGVALILILVGGLIALSAKRPDQR